MGMALERTLNSKRVRGLSARLPFVRPNPLGLELFLTFTNVPPLSSGVSLSILSSWHSSCIVFYDSYIYTNIWCARDLCGSAYEISIIHKNTKGVYYFIHFGNVTVHWKLKKENTIRPKIGRYPSRCTTPNILLVASLTNICNMRTAGLGTSWLYKALRSLAKVYPLS